MTKNNNQCVYFFSQKGGNQVKIGMTRTNDISNRFRQFCTYSPYGGKVLGVIKTDDSLKLEREIHKELANRRLKGEFFLISEDDCNSIIERYNSNETNDIVSNFMLWLSSPDANIDNLNTIFKRAISMNEEPVEEKLSYHKLIEKYFNTEKRVGYMTATEMKDIIEGREMVSISSMKIFGSNLKDVFGKSKMKKINGVPMYRYYVGINI